ncbi:MAG: GTPase Era [Proteobacteria bacterium]|nr:GTPase Era [Pseudomonadota bacterium]MBU1714156.1 GTPase Era [Pseudomonadota bacterium]
MPEDAKIKSGVVALVGSPNVGKSTLLNSLLGQKISIVSPKPQTTRNRILGIINGPDHQIVMLDTPGIHQAHNQLNIEMVKIAMDTLSEVDVVLFIVDATFPLPQKNPEATKWLAEIKKPAILVLNKIDLLSREKLLPILKIYQELYPFTAIIPLSALNNDGTDILLQELLAILPEGPRLYPEDIPTDATERFIVAEIIREKIFLLIGQEIPYATAVVIDRFHEDEERGLVTIDATIFVEKASQKGIIIGNKGSKLKQIGKAARHDIEVLLAQQVMLKLWVKIKKNWTKDTKFLRDELGF